MRLHWRLDQSKPRVNTQTHESFLQAIVDIGYLDTKVDNISPMDQHINILGASSDHLMLDLNGQGHYQVGMIYLFH